MPPIGRRRNPPAIPPVERRTIEQADRIRENAPPRAGPADQPDREKTLRQLQYDATQNPDITGGEKYRAKVALDEERKRIGLPKFDWKEYYRERQAAGFRS